MRAQPNPMGKVAQCSYCDTIRAKGVKVCPGCIEAQKIQMMHSNERYEYLQAHPELRRLQYVDLPPDPTEARKTGLLWFIGGLLLTGIGALLNLGLYAAAEQQAIQAGESSFTYIFFGLPVLAGIGVTVKGLTMLIAPLKKQ